MTEDMAEPGAAFEPEPESGGGSSSSGDEYDDAYDDGTRHDGPAGEPAPDATAPVTVAGCERPILRAIKWTFDPAAGIAIVAAMTAKKWAAKLSPGMVLVAIEGQSVAGLGVKGIQAAWTRLGVRTAALTFASAAEARKTVAEARRTKLGLPPTATDEECAAIQKMVAWCIKLGLPMTATNEECTAEEATRRTRLGLPPAATEEECCVAEDPIMEWRRGTRTRQSATTKPSQTARPASRSAWPG